MPIIEMHLVAGRTSEQKSRVAAAVTDAVCASLNCAPETVRVLITEHGREEFYVGGMTLDQRAARREQTQ